MEIDSRRDDHDTQEEQTSDEHDENKHLNESNDSMYWMDVSNDVHGDKGDFEEEQFNLDAVQSSKDKAELQKEWELCRQ